MASGAVRKKCAKADLAGEVDADETMGVLREYYETLGRLITAYEATLTNISGDGLMMLLNAPVPCSDPLSLALRMAVEMQKAVQSLIAVWRRRGHSLGFGVGLAKGAATVGRIGYEGRVDYTAIGSVVNLASRLCGAAADGQILICPASAGEAKVAAPVRALGRQAFKGFPDGVDLHEVLWREEQPQSQSGEPGAEASASLAAAHLLDGRGGKPGNVLARPRAEARVSQPPLRTAAGRRLRL